MAIPLDAITTPVFVRYLRLLSATLSSARSYTASAGIEQSDLLDARLVDGMFPLAQQVSTACSFALRACFPLLRRDVPPLAGGQSSFEELNERITATVSALEALASAEIAAGEAVPVTTQAGFATLHFSGRDHVLLYAMPNFFFHLAMAHAILRSRGVPVGKQDFDGWHAYPPGFRFGEP